MRVIPIENSTQPIINDVFSAFIEEIKNGNVLLMVGRAFEANVSTFGGDFYDFILKKLNSLEKIKELKKQEKIEGTILDFSDLSYLYKSNDHTPISELHVEIIKAIYYENKENAIKYSAQEDVSNSLMSLIRTGMFRFVFTTSFDPLVEIAMKEQFGEVRVMNIYDKSNRDIKHKSDLEIPTIYYLFGKAMLPEKNITKEFVATDNDALKVLKKWQIDMSNSNLLRYAEDKYLLTLGCTQQDWLFRFIWYTLKGEGGKLSKGYIAGHDSCESLSRYLKMNKILIDNNAEELTIKILDALNRDEDAKWETPQRNCDVFISYSRADSEIASQLYKSLTSQGLKVWYDKKNLGGRHGGRFMDILRESIDTSTLFIAILSQSISEQAQEIHVYRREWEWAKDFKFGLTADCRCYAAFADNYDINANKYKDALGWLAETDNYEFSTLQPNFDEWAKVLRLKINDIKSKKAHG